MTRYKPGAKSAKAFTRWCFKGDEDYQRAVEYALEALLPPFEDAGFDWVEENLEGFRTPSYMIDLERRSATHAERVTINFDKHRRYRFNVIVRVKEIERPQNWLRAGDLVARKGRSYSQKWWGASSWSPFKVSVFKKNVDKVTRLLPQIFKFLEDGTAGPNLWEFENE